MKKTYRILIIIALLLLTVGLIYTVLQLRSSKQENVELVKNFELDKQELESEYDNFARQYDELQFTIQNDSLAEKLSKEQARVQELLQELRSVKSSNASEIRRLKDELATLRKILIGYVHQIDSLNRENKDLREQTLAITQRYQQVAAEASTLAQEKQSLTEKVSLAAQLNATGIALISLNKKGRNASKIKDVARFQINFTLARNVTAETGMQTIYVRLVKPGNQTLAKSGDTFTYENRSLPYSIRRTVEYTGEEMPVTVYWDVTEFLESGTYRVEIFTNGQLIGSRSVSVK